MNNLSFRNVLLISKFLNIKNLWEMEASFKKASMCSDSPLATINNGRLMTTEQDKFFGTKSSSLGKGSYGQVWKTTGNFAYKYMQKSKHSIKEIAIMHYADHPNVLCIVGMFKDDNNIVSVMQVADIGTLEDIHLFLKTHDEQRKKAFYQIFLGLAYIAELYIIHYDIKPGNIFVFKDGKSEDYTYKIADFGLSEICTYVQNNRNISPGTPFWMSPEVLAKRLGKGNAQQTTKIDIWSVGIIMYDIIYQTSLKGRSIYFSNDQYSILDYIIHNTKVRDDTSAKFAPGEQELANRCLTIKPEDRPSALQCLNDIYFTTIHNDKDIILIKENNKSIPNNVKDFNNRKNNVSFIFNIVGQMNLNPDISISIGFYAVSLFDVYFSIKSLPNINFDNLKYRYNFLANEQLILWNHQLWIDKENHGQYVEFTLTGKEADEQFISKDFIENFNFLKNYKTKTPSHIKKLYEELYSDIETSKNLKEYKKYLMKAQEIMDKYFKFRKIIDVMIGISVYFIESKDLKFTTIDIFDEVLDVLINNLYVPTAIQYYVHKYNTMPDIDTLKIMAAALVKYTNQETLVNDIKNLSAKWQDEKFMALEFVKRDWKEFENLNEKWRNDKDIILEAVKQNGELLKNLDKKWQDDYDIVLEAVNSRKHAIVYASSTLKTNKDIIITVTRRNSNIAAIVKTADKILVDNETFMFEAIKEDYRERKYYIEPLLKYASTRLKNDKAFILTLVKKVPKVFKEVEYYENIIHISMDLQKNKEFILEMVKISPKIVCCNQNFQKDKDIMLEAIKSAKHDCFDIFEYISSELKHDKVFIKKAIEHCPNIYHSLDYDMKNDITGDIPR